MAIKGSLKEASLPDVLQLLSMGQKTGCLSLTDRSNFGYIFFERGRISYASIVNRRDRLGDLLVKNRLLTSETLAEAVEAQASRPEQKLGELLIERGAITAEQLEHYIRVQIEEAVYFLFTWSQGSFYFEADQRPEEGAMLVSINPENLLLEGARRIDEWSLIEKRIPSLDLIFQADEARPVPDDLELTPDHRKVLPLLNGSHSVQEVIEESGMVEFDGAKAIFGLLQAGLVHPVGKRQPEVREVPTARIEEHQNLGVAFYRTGMHDEAMREFRRVTELQPRDVRARFYLGLIGVRKADLRFALRHLMEVVELGGSRVVALHDLALALEAAGRLEEALETVEEALRAREELPAPHLSRAVLRLKLRRPIEARESLARHRELLGEKRPSATYYAFAVLTEAACGSGPRARQLAEEGLGHHPHSAPLLLHAGALREREGDWEGAQTFYQRAAEEDESLPQARKSLGDALYRAGAHEEACVHYRKAIELQPDLGDDVYFKLGNIHYKRMERAEAVRLWRQALELNPENSVVRTNLELVEGAMAAGGVP
jgi:tetratricopeptide (TPR) repeat protein